MRNRILTKAAVLEAAEHIIVSEGMDQCSMRRISSELGVAVGTIYNYYDSRETLLVELFSISWNRTIEKTRAVIEPSKTRWEQLDRFFDIIQEDVDNRSGLGKEVYLFSGYSPNPSEDVVNIRKELTLVVQSILNQKPGAEDAHEVLSHWIITLLVDALINDRRMTDLEMTILSRLLETDMSQLGKH